MNDAILANLLASLNIAILEQQREGWFSVCGTPPSWFFKFFPESQTPAELIRPGQAMPFLENFLVDAKDFWIWNLSGQIKSGIWSEFDADGQEYQLEASAVCLGHTKLLLIEFPRFAYEEKLHIIQTGRETTLNYQQLIKEIQKKEILLHCIFHDLKSPLSGSRWALENLLKKKESLVTSEKEILESCLQATIKQQELIEEVLQIIFREGNIPQTFTPNPALDPDIVQCARRVVAILLPVANQQRVEFQFSGMNPKENWKVCSETQWLERVFFNLLENALKFSPPDSVITIRFTQEKGSITSTIDDEGPGVPPKKIATLFDRNLKGNFSQKGTPSIGLYFCQVAVQRWGGSIGYIARAQGGARFWFRLIKSSSDSR